MTCREAQGQVSVSLKPDVELEDLILWVMSFTCQNFVFHASIRGRAANVIIKVPETMSPRQSWRVFLVALQVMNLIVVPQGGSTLRIIDSAEAKTESAPELVSIVIQPEHVSPKHLATALAAMKSIQGTVSLMPNTGILVVTDHSHIINEMRSLIDELE